MTTALWIVLICLNAFVALTAIGGGIALVAGLEKGRLSEDLLKGTPFNSFLIPGLMLAVMVGGSAVTATALLLIDRSIGWQASVVAGVIMAGWIVGEVRLLNQPSMTRTEGVYLGIGLMTVGLSVALWATID